MSEELAGVRKDLTKLAEAQKALAGVVEQNRSASAVKELATAMKTLAYNQGILESKLEDLLKNQMNTDLLVNNVNDRLNRLMSALDEQGKRETSVPMATPIVRSASELSNVTDRGPGRPRAASSRRGPGRPRKDQTAMVIAKLGGSNLNGGDRESSDPNILQPVNIVLPTGSVKISKNKKFFLEANSTMNEDSSQPSPPTIVSTEPPKRKRGRPPKRRTVEVKINNNMKKEKTTNGFDFYGDENSEDMQTTNASSPQSSRIGSPSSMAVENSTMATSSTNNTKSIASLVDPVPDVTDINKIITPMEKMNSSFTVMPTEKVETNNQMNENNISSQFRTPDDGTPPIRSYTDPTNGENTIITSTGRKGTQEANANVLLGPLSAGAATSIPTEFATDSEAYRQQRELDKRRDDRERMLVNMKYNDRDKAKSFIESNKKLLQAMKDEERRKKMSAIICDISGQTANATENGHSIDSLENEDSKLPGIAQYNHDEVFAANNDAPITSSWKLDESENYSANQKPHPLEIETMNLDQNRSQRIEQNSLVQNKNDYRAHDTMNSKIDNDANRKRSRSDLGDGDELEVGSIVNEHGIAETSALDLKLDDFDTEPYEQSITAAKNKRNDTISRGGFPGNDTEAREESYFEENTTTNSNSQSIGHSSQNNGSEQISLLAGSPIELLCRDGFFYSRNSMNVPINTGSYLEYKFKPKEEELVDLINTKENFTKRSRTDRMNALFFKLEIEREVEFAFQILYNTTLTEKYVNSLEYFLMEFRWENRLVSLGMKLRESKRTWQRRKALFALFEFWRDQSRGKRGFQEYTILHAVKEMENYRIFINRSVSWFYNHITLLKMILYDLCDNVDTQWREWMFPKNQPLPLVNENGVTMSNLNEAIDNVLVFCFLDDGSENRQVKSSQVVPPQNSTSGYE